MEYFNHIVTLVAIYTLLAQSLNVFSGNTGLLSLAHAGFYGIGAYTTALLSIHFSSPIIINFIFAASISGIIAFLLSFIALRTYEDYFLVVTMGIQIIIFSLMNNLIPLTNGPFGLTNIPGVPLFDRGTPFMIFSILIAGGAYFLLWKLSKSSWTLNLKGISDDEILMQALGKHVQRIKIIAFVLSAMIASIAGVLYAHYISYIDPTSFTIHESIFILAIVIIGGLGNVHGAFFAAIFMVLLPEILRFVGLPDAIGANIRQMIYGALLIGLTIAQEKKGKLEFRFTSNATTRKGT